MKRFSPAALAALFQPSRMRTTMRLGRWAMLGLLAIVSVAGARGLDKAFTDDGVDLTSITGTDMHAIAHLPRADGGSFVMLSYQVANSCPAGKWCLLLLRFTDSGVLNGLDYVPVSANFTEAKAAAVDSQGRIVVVGSMQFGSSEDYDFRIVRVTPTGALDTTFDADGIRDIAFDVEDGTYEDKAFAVAIDASDRIVVAGHAVTSNVGDFQFAIARLKTDGTLDPLFNGGGKRLIPYEVNPGRSFAIANAVAVDSTGRIVIGGTVFDLSLGRTRIGMARLLPSGDYDTAWCSPSCGVGNAYPAINSGRSVPYYGDSSEQRNHTVAALAVNASGVVGIVGNHTYENVARGFAMTLNADGTWRAEKTIVGGTASFVGQSSMGGVAFVSRSAPNPDLVVTGVKGNPGGDWSYFFAQCLTNTSGTLVPRAYWGNDTLDGESTSTIYFYARVTAPDPYGSIPHASAIDAKGRVLMSGAAIFGSALTGVAARLEGDEVFRNGFE